MGEQVKCDDECDVPMEQYHGPTSFGELDEMRMAQEQAWYISDLTYRLTDMIRNVFNSDLPDKRTALSTLVAEYNDRIQNPPAANKSIINRIWARMKAQTKTEGGVAYQASDYADVPDATKPDTWKLRLAETESGNFTVAQVGRAITAMQDGGFRGNEVELGSDKAGVIAKISAAIGKTDGTDEQKEALKKRLDAVKSLGTQDYTVFKDSAGQWRWLGVSTNRWEDREDETLTDPAHREYKAWLDANPNKAPHKWSWHTPWTKSTYPADWWDYANGFFIWSGVLTNEEAEVETKVTGQRGMSHGFFVLDRDPLNKNNITQYRTFEVSDLSIGAAANVLTDFAVLSKENDMFTTRREYLVAKFGEDRVAKAEQALKKGEAVLDMLQSFGKEYGGNAEVMEQAIVFFKEIVDGVPSTEPIPDEPVQSTPPAVAPVPDASPTVDDVVGKILKAIDAKGLQTVLQTMSKGLASSVTVTEALQQEVATLKGQLATMEGQVKALARDDDQKLADQYSSFNWGIVLDNRPTAQTKNQVKENEGTLPVAEAEWMPAAFS